ncbi:MAG: RNA-binding protein [Tannerella sp.]|jgi:RNA recognition motif-containing protein|nr:RNA-binding protein [Tannerella sp.]
MNIYISGLSYSINDADLNELFTEYGEVSSAKIINDRETGRSRGFGFVEMPNDADGQKAIDELNGAEYDNKVISVSEARPRTERSSFGGGGGGNRNRGSNNGFRRNNGGSGFGRNNGGGGFGRY